MGRVGGNELAEEGAEFIGGQRVDGATGWHGERADVAEDGAGVGVLEVYEVGQAEATRREVNRVEATGAGKALVAGGVAARARP